MRAALYAPPPVSVAAMQDHAAAALSTLEQARQQVFCACGLTGRQAGELFKVNHVTISDWCRGQRPAPHAVKLLVDILLANRSFADRYLRTVLNEKPEPPRPTYEQRKLDVAYRKADKHRAEMLSELDVHIERHERQTDITMDQWLGD